MIRKHYSLRHADKILAKLFEILGSTEECDNEITVECWSNCREQGYRLRCYNKSVCFAQERRSDLLMVIHGPTNQFDITTNMPDKDLWYNQKNFGDDDEAVAYIIDKLGVIEGMVSD